MSLLDKIKKLCSKEFLSIIWRYGLISVIGYVYVFTLMYVLVDVYSINESVAFLLIYGTLYLFLYVAQLKFVFKKEHTKNTSIRFILSILLYYTVGNLLFNLFVYLGFAYLMATIITLLVQVPFKFFFSKKIVFK